MTGKRAPHEDPDDEDERRLFAEAMKDVAPLPPDRRGRVRPGRPPMPTGRVRPTTRPLADPDLEADADADEDGSSYIAPGVDPRALRKLRRGSYVPGRRLDLHGMSSREAREAVSQFIATARGAFRCIAIVHGRGLHSDRNVAILRTAVRALLRAHPTVLAYSDAPREDGGSGAVYVLLRG